MEPWSQHKEETIKQEKNNSTRKNVARKKRGQLGLYEKIKTEKKKRHCVFWRIIFFFPPLFFCFVFQTFFSLQISRHGIKEKCHTQPSLRVCAYDDYLHTNKTKKKNKQKKESSSKVSKPNKNDFKKWEQNSWAFRVCLIMTVALIIQRVDKKKVISTISRNLSSYVFLCVCVCVEKHARHDPRGSREKKKTANILGHKKIEIENKLRSQKRNTEEPEKESSTYKLCVCVFIGRDFSIPLSLSRKKKKTIKFFFSSFPLFRKRFAVHLLSEDCSNFALHKGPRNIGPG